MFDLIKAVSDTVFDMLNVVYHDKPLIFIRATLPEKHVSHHRAVSILCILCQQARPSVVGDVTFATPKHIASH